MDRIPGGYLRIRANDPLHIAHVCVGQPRLLWIAAPIRVLLLQARQRARELARRRPETQQGSAYAPGEPDGPRTERLAKDAKLLQRHAALSKAIALRRGVLPMASCTEYAEGAVTQWALQRC